MINRVFLDVNEEKIPVIFTWSFVEEDYVFEQIPENLTLYELNELVDEVNRITQWEG